MAQTDYHNANSKKTSFHIVTDNLNATEESSFSLLDKDREGLGITTGLLTPPSSTKKPLSLSPEQRARIDHVKQRAFSYIHTSSEAAIHEARQEVNAMYSRLAQQRLKCEQRLASISSRIFENDSIVYDPNLYLMAREDGKFQGLEFNVVSSKIPIDCPTNNVNSPQSPPTTPIRQSSHAFASPASLWDRRPQTIRLPTPPYTPIQPTTTVLSPAIIQSPSSPFTPSYKQKFQPPTLDSLTAALLAIPPSDLPSRSTHGPCAQCTALAMPCNAAWPSCQRCTLRLHLASAKASRTGRDNVFYALSDHCAGGAECCIPQCALPSPVVRSGSHTDTTLPALLAGLRCVSFDGSVLVPVRLSPRSCVVHAHHGDLQSGISADEVERRHWEGQVRQYMELVRAELHKRERANWIAPRQERDCGLGLFI